MYPSYGSSQERPYGKILYLRRLIIIPPRNAVRHDHFRYAGVVYCIYRASRKPRGRATGVDLGGALLLKGLRGLGKGSGSVHHVVKKKRRLALDLSYYVHHLGYIRLPASLVHYREPRLKPLRERPRPLHPSGIRRNHHYFIRKITFHIFGKHRRREKIINRYVKNPLYLSGVQIQTHAPRGPGNGDKVGYELRRYRRPRRHLPVLPRVPVIGYDGRYVARGRPL